MPTYRRTFPGLPEEIHKARRFIRQCLDGSPVAADAGLIVSELATNALRHTASGSPAGTFHVTVVLGRQVLAISVTDDGGTKADPETKHPGTEATCGRGLGIVTALAAHVEVHGDHQGRTITATLPMPRHGARQC